MHTCSNIERYECYVLNTNYYVYSGFYIEPSFKVCVNKVKCTTVKTFKDMNMTALHTNNLVNRGLYRVPSLIVWVNKVKCTPVQTFKDMNVTSWIQTIMYRVGFT